MSLLSQRGLFLKPAGGGGSTDYIPVSWAMSSVYGGLSANVTNMRDGVFTTGAATDPDADAFIQADLGSPKLVNSVEVAGGNLPGWGGVSAYLNTRVIQYYNGSTWVNAGTVSGASDSAPFITTVPIAGITAQLWRLYGTTYTATTEFRLYP